MSHWLDRFGDPAVVQVLRARAATLAAASHQRTAAGASVVLFRRAGQTLGLELAETEGTGRLRGMSAVPGGPSWLEGVTLDRGGVLSLIDLPCLWGVPQQGVADLPLYVVARSGDRRLGILAEQLYGVHELDDAWAPYAGSERLGIAGVGHRGAVPVLKLSGVALLSDSRFR